MKQRLLSLALVLAMFCSLLPPVRSETDLNFLAVNDSLPYALEAATMPFYSGGTLYIPYNIFEQVSSLEVWASYNPANQTLVLFNKTRKLLFYLSDGTVVDENDNSYALGVIVRNGLVFVPANYCISYFGSTLNYLTSLGGYTVLRITTGSQVLSNSTFINQADTLIEEMAAAYLASIAPAEPTTPAQVTQPAQSTQQTQPQQTVTNPTPENTGEPETADPSEETTPPEETVPETAAPVYQIYPLILGPSQAAADWLAEHNQTAAFFLTARQIETSPAFVRQLLCAGHTVGLAGKTASSLDRANTALYAAAGEQTLLALSQDGLTAAGYLFCPGDLEAETFYWNPTQTDSPVPVVLDGEDPLLCDYLDAFLAHCTLHQLVETSAPVTAGTDTP